jgi:hypothetical protein
MTRSVLRSRAVAACLMLAVSVGSCSDGTGSTPLSGTWTGANASFTGVSLTLQQNGPGITGTASLTIVNGGWSGSGLPLTGSVGNGQIQLQIGPLPPESGVNYLSYVGAQVNGQIHGKMADGSSDPPLLVLTHS